MARPGHRSYAAVATGALKELAVPLVSVALAVLAGSVIMLVSGFDPVAAFAAMLEGAFGGGRQIGETMLRATPLMFTGLAVAYGFRAGLFNIGAEGQLFMGGLAAAFLGIALAGLPRPLNIVLMLVAGAAIGAAWAFIPALLKANIGAHEVITTMMFTFIGRYIVSWLVTGPLKAEGQIPQTEALPVESTLPKLHEVLPFLADSRAHLGFVIAVVLAMFVWWVLKYTSLGYESRAVGFNPSAAETGGISVPATTVKALCISGALAGLAGVTEVMGVHLRLFDQFSPGFGFTGIAVALLAKNNPIGVIVAAILFGALSAGALPMQLEAEVPTKVIFIIQALIIFLVAAEQLARWVLGRGRQEARDVG
ncbi:MAG TPA: ABC transporter permease [Coriobacteriia bacterium]|nr:ABC transporter permease [Coriobacteriia bacterium]